MFAHGHRNLFGVSPQDTLKKLSEKINGKYAKDISAYLFKLHKQRIPLSETQLIFYSDSLKITDSDSPLEMETLLKNIPEGETEGVTWYPEWTKNKEDKIYTKPQA